MGFGGFPLRITLLSSRSELTHCTFCACRCAGGGHAVRSDFGGSRSETTLQQTQQTRLTWQLLHADVWAAGIILYVMVFGGFPFEDSSRSTPRSNHGIIKRLVRVRDQF